MAQEITKEYTKNGKTLLLVVASFNGIINKEIADVIGNIFEDISSKLNEPLQFLYIRDLENYIFEIDGKKYMGSTSLSKTEIMINVPGWPTNITQLKATVAKELYNITSQQNNDKNSLGEYILSNGLAVKYGYQLTNWSPPWVQGEPSDTKIKDMLKSWDSTDYNKDYWMYEKGGTVIGYYLAMRLFPKSTNIQELIQVNFNEAKNKFLALYNK